ncbi:phosphatase PAP2 family protein [Novosphingobium sp. 9]|uniref:phosphatase PAP2 family protein n=1 Tax=Novosphingobium sp. 9 TaxID=2025349 RepID=UPI0021B5E3A1|nr:phosphatase PAP2 family protein [Novosphingobium sp. 9]
MPFSASAIRYWLLCLVVCMAVSGVAFVHFDLAIERYFHHVSKSVKGLESGLAGTVLMALEFAMIAAMLGLRLFRHRSSNFEKAVILACVTSILAYDVNSNILKVLFGVPNPADVLHGAWHGFYWFAGSEHSSFPSGHMALAGAFAGVFMQRYRWSVWPLGALLAIAAVTLVIGGWHFVSDVLVGTFVGVTAGLVAAVGARRYRFLAPTGTPE